MSASSLHACHECDLLQRVPAVPDGGAALCVRCEAVLLRPRPNSIDRVLALTIAGFVLFITANAFPFLTMRMQGNATSTTLVSGVRSLYEGDMVLLAILVLVTSIIAPLLYLSSLLYVFLPLRLNRAPWAGTRVFRSLHRLQPWSMVEVFMLGVLVSLVKLADMAEILPGIALWAFTLLIPVLAGTAAALDPEAVWSRLEALR